VRDRSKAKACSICGRARREDEKLSSRGRCDECRQERIVEWMQRDRATSDAKWWARYRRGVAASIGIDLDVLQTQESDDHAG
jgi:hypothetical protein